MSHRAAIYSVRVHPRGEPKDPLKLGDVDELGTYLGTALNEFFNDSFVSKNDETGREARCISSKVQGDEVQAVFQHGESGLTADILDQNDQRKLRQLPQHRQLVRCGSLFKLGRNQSLGWWAVHINNNRGGKGLIGAELHERFRQRFGNDLMLVTDPAVMTKVFAEALEDGRLNSVKLQKYEKPSDLADIEKWVPGGSQARIELQIFPERGKHLRPNFAKRALAGDNNALGEIIEFEGLTFETAKLAVTLKNGSQRTFNVEHPESGHPFTADIDPKTKQDGEPKDASVFKELGRVLGEME